MLSARSPVCGRARRALECRVDADNAGILVVGPWQYQSGGWVVPLPWYPVYHPPVTHLARTPGTHLTCTPRPTGGMPGTTGTCTYDRFQWSQGGPRGVKRTG